MKTIREHPFAAAWWSKGVIPTMSLLKRLDLLEPSLTHPNIILLAIRMVLGKKGLLDEFEEFLEDLCKDRNTNKLCAEMNWRLLQAIRLAMGDASGIIEVMSEEDLDDHARRCSDPKCKIRKLLQEADKVAVEGLKLGLRL